MLLGLLQGATELFPVSSLGHAVLLPRLLGWHYNQSHPDLCPLRGPPPPRNGRGPPVYFREEWVALIRAFVTAVYRGRVEGPEQRLALLLLVGTIPAGLLGVFFESELKKLFANPRAAAAFLCLNGVIMGGGEVLRRLDARRRRLATAEIEAGYGGERELGFFAAVAVGTSQGLALLPGISRSGVTITAGLAAGLRHEAAARYSFLLATPIILAAGLLEVPSLTAAGGQIWIYLAGAALAGVTAYLSVRYLVRYFRSGGLAPFAVYCVVLGLAGLWFVR